MLKKLTLLMAALLTLAMIATACGDSDDNDSAGNGDNGDTVAPAQTTGGRLQAVRDRGHLICGTRNDLIGLAMADADGNYSGFDIEFCKVVAAGIFGDATKVEYRPLDSADRFIALSSGEVDLLIRNTTYTATRDGQEGANFLMTTLYDGQGFIVKADSGITSIRDLNGANICVTQGTTTQKNLSTVFASMGIDFTSANFPNATELRSAYQSGTCDAYTSDSSALAAYKFNAEQNSDERHVILPEIISKEPLGIVVADGDTEWAQAVNWSAMATIQAWEFGLTQSNIEDYDGNDGNILNFLGRDNFNPGLGLDTDFAINIVSQVGNYEEIYNRTPGATGDAAGHCLGWLQPSLDRRRPALRSTL